MSKLKRMRRKRVARKHTNIRLMSLHSGMKESPGSGKLLKRMTRDHHDLLQNIEFIFRSIENQFIVNL